MKKKFIAELVIVLLAATVASCKKTPSTTDAVPDTTTIMENAQDSTDFLFEEVPDSVLFEVSEYAVPVKNKGGQPTMADFINAILSQEETFDAYVELSRCWEQFKRGKTLPEGRSIVLDEKERYMRFDETEVLENGSTYTGFNEYVCWDFADGKHQLVMENTVNCRDGVPFAGQFSGLSFFIYDMENRKMWLTSDYSIGGDFEMEMPEDTHLIVHKVTNKDKSIDYVCHTDNGIVTKHMVWDGRRIKAMK